MCPHPITLRREVQTTRPSKLTHPKTHSVTGKDIGHTALWHVCNDIYFMHVRLPHAMECEAPTHLLTRKCEVIVWVHQKRDKNYRRYPTTSRHKLPTATRIVTKQLPTHYIFT